MNGLERESCVAHILSDADILSSVSTLRRVMESCVGPSCNCHLVHNDVGGHVVVSATATTLMSATQMSSPVLRLLTSAVQQHVAVYADGGTTTATLLLLMTEHALQMSPELHRQRHSLIVDLFDVVADLATSYLTSECCQERRLLSIDSLSDLLKLLRGVLSTKPVCGMSDTDVEHMSSCLLNIALTQLSSTTARVSQSLNNSNHFTTIVLLGRAVSRSYVQSGTVVEASHLPVYQTAEQQHRPNSLSVTLARLDSGLRQRAANHQCNDYSGYIAVAMFSTSLAGGGSHGDEDDVTDYVIETSWHVDADQCVVTRLLATAQTVVDCGADVCLCQKVIHPRVKRFLRSEGILVLDRLGHQTARQLARQTGAQLISAPFTPVCADQLGRLDRITHQLIDSKSYVCFEGGPRATHTLLLCAVTEAAANELQRLSHAAYDVLLRGLSERSCLVGAGCWQRQLAQYLRSISREELSQGVVCRTVDVENVVDCVVRSLERLAELIQPHQGGRNGSSEKRCGVERHTRLETDIGSSEGRLEVESLSKHEAASATPVTLVQPFKPGSSQPKEVRLTPVASSLDHERPVFESSHCERSEGQDLARSEEHGVHVLDLTSTCVSSLRTAISMTQSVLKLQFSTEIPTS